MSQPTNAELDILQVLWKLQPCTVRMIHNQLVKTKEVGYTTTLKQMQRMEDKGIVIRIPHAKGKSILYKATEKASITKSKIVDKVVKNVFNNSISELVLHALGNEKVTPEEIAKIEALLEKINES